MVAKEFGKRHIRLLTFDAFGTLFTPREPISKQYGDVARSFGLKGFTDADIALSFRDAFKRRMMKDPNYGKAVGMAAHEWWADVIHSTFRALIPASTPLPQPLIPNLLSRFSSSEGYKLYPDVLPFFHALRESKQVVDQGAEKAVPSNFGVGVVTNSDDRVPLVLSSLGLEIGSSRHRLLKTPSIESSNDEDIKFVVMSYDVGSEKPDREIFDAARALGSVNGGFENECLHVGDDVQKDYQGAKDAGWNSLLLDRGHRYNPKKIPLLSNLDELRAILF